MARTKTYDLEEERDRIDEELDALADEAAALDEGDTLSDEKQRRAQQLERQLLGLEWALNPDDHEDREPWTEIVLSELTAGSYVRAGARAEQDAQKSSAVVGSDTERLYRVASAIEDADFLPAGATFDQTLIQVGQLKPQFFFWLEQEVDDLTTPSIEGNGFAQRVAAKEADENNSNTPG